MHKKKKKAGKNKKASKREAKKHNGESKDSIRKQIMELSRLYEIAREGMSFEEQIVNIREQNKLWLFLEKGEKIPKKRLNALNRRMQGSEKASMQAVNKIKKLRSVSPILLRGNVHRFGSISDGDRNYYNVIDGPTYMCPEPVRRWNFNFDKGDTTPDINAPTVTDVTEGFVGWRNLPGIYNYKTDQETTSQLWLTWERKVPFDGTFSYWLSAHSLRVQLGYKLWGNGLWGTDAWLTITIYTGVSVGGHFLVGYSEKLVDESVSAKGSKSGSVSKWIPVGINGMFRGTKNQLCTVEMQLEIKHWSGNGGTWVDINDFWYPANDPNKDIALVD